MFKDKSIALFFSYNVSLSTWENCGILSREAKIWDIFSKNFKQIIFITYGDKADEQFQQYFPGTKVLFNKWRLPAWLYSLLIPFIYRSEIINIDICKVNQLSGSLPALLCKLLYKKKLIVRCGFQLSVFFKKQKENIIKQFFAFLLEKLAYSFAEVIMVTSGSDKDYISGRYKIKTDKIKIVPNGVDTQVFKVLDNVARQEGRILFVGRLIEQKDLPALLAAVSGIDKAKLVIIGKGKLKTQLRQTATQLKLEVDFIDSIKNVDLPFEYNKADIFVLPSFFEGNPKVLLEAMACGLAVIGSDVCGINNLIRHGDNGLLCDTSVFGIRAAIASLLSDVQLREKLGRNARNFIIENFDLSSLIYRELVVSEEIFLN